MRTLRQLHDIEARRILLRVDYNLPISEGKIEDETRIIESLDTVRYLLDHRARLIMCTHLGRPEGKPDPALRLDPIIKRFRSLLDERGIETAIRKANEIVGNEVEQLVEATKPGEIAFLENVRFDPREEQNEPQFSAELAKLAESYVDDAFGAIHRAHASTVGVAKLLPIYAGLLVEREVEHLEYLKNKPDHPFVVVLGGAKPDDKIAMIQSLRQRVDTFLVAGGIANTFLQAMEDDIQESLVGDDKALATAKELLPVLGEKLVLPVDFVWEGKKIMDVGEKTIALFEKHLMRAKTIFWNGNLGKSEEKRFAKGTRAIAKAIAASRAHSVVGGGDTVAAIDQYGLRQHISFISTGGGATLEFLAGKSLPGLEVLGYRPKG